MDARTRVWDQLENTAGNTNTSGNFRKNHGGSTALLFAARNGDVETARALVEAGADVNDVAAAGTSALVIAAHSGHGALGIYLLEQGADPNAAGAGYTALHAATLRSQVELAAALLERGAAVDAVVERGTPGRRFSADFSIRHQAVGANAFWLAARYGELEILRTLAERGADPHVSPANRWSALKAAMGVPQISQEDRRNRVDAPDDHMDSIDQEQLTLDLARIILDLGVDVNQARRPRQHRAPRRGADGLLVGRRFARGAWRGSRRAERPRPDAADPGRDPAARHRQQRPAIDAAGDRRPAARARRRRVTCGRRDHRPPRRGHAPGARRRLNRLRPEDRAVHDWYRFVLSFPSHLVRDYLDTFGVDSTQRVLDPFCGTGTTLVECKKLGIPSVGIERKSDGRLREPAPRWIGASTPRHLFLTPGRSPDRRWRASGARASTTSGWRRCFRRVGNELPCSGRCLPTASVFC